jgi:hypothetical protein
MASRCGRNGEGTQRAEAPAGSGSRGAVAASDKPASPRGVSASPKPGLATPGSSGPGPAGARR